jgi:ABC-2 type transport system permease protein
MNMLNDIFTMIWKEFREIILNRRGMRGGLMNMAVLVAVLGVFMPLQTGPAWLDDPRQLLIWAWMPIFIALGNVTDAFAGERERRTLETLLATRLSDQAILFGKLLAVVLYAWLLSVASIIVGAVTVNIAHPAATIQFYPLATIVIGLLASFLGPLLVACIGVLVSLKASTVRAAFQRMSIFMLALWFIPLIGFQVMPDDLRQRLLQTLSTIDFDQVILWVLVGLTLANAILVAVVNVSFRRARLILS